TQLDQCLKGKAELWYTNEISNTTRAGLKASIENWCTELETRFRMSPGVALEKLEKLKYTISDVRRRKDPEEFVQNIVVLGKSAGIADTEYSQILTAHRHLAAELRIHIPAPTIDTNLTTFIKQIGQKKDDWFEIWRPSQMTNWHTKEPTRTYNNLYQSFLPESSRQNFSREKLPVNPAGPHRFSKNHEMKNSTGNNFLSKPPNFKKDENKNNFAPRNKFKPRQQAYQNQVIEDNEIPNETKDLGNDELNDYDDAYFQGIEEYETENQYDSNEEKDPQLYVQNVNLVQMPKETNFQTYIRPPASPREKTLMLKSDARINKCLICKAIFNSKNKLHSHLRRDHPKLKSKIHSKPPITDDSITNQKQNPINDNNKTLIVPPHSPSPIDISRHIPQIVSSTAPLSKAPPGYAFRGRRYAQVELTIESPQNEAHLKISTYNLPYD
ncbi:hypothetical protein OnM2_034088, partial [Erysiphe neolycopersici]